MQAPPVPQQPALGAPPPWGGTPPAYAQPMNQAPGFAAMGAPPVPPSAPFPPPGWYAHPSQPGAYHNTKEIKSEADLRELQRMGRA